MTHTLSKADQEALYLGRILLADKNGPFVPDDERALQVAYRAHCEDAHEMLFEDLADDYRVAAESAGEIIKTIDYDEAEAAKESGGEEYQNPDFDEDGYPAMYSPQWCRENKAA